EGRVRVAAGPAVKVHQARLIRLVVGPHAEAAQRVHAATGQRRYAVSLNNAQAVDQGRRVYLVELPYQVLARGVPRRRANSRPLFDRVILVDEVGGTAGRKLLRGIGGAVSG